MINKKLALRRSAIIGFSAIALSTFAFSAQATNLVKNGDFNPNYGTNCTTNCITPSAYITNPYSPTFGVPLPEWTTTSGYSFVISDGTAATTDLDAYLGIPVNPLWPANGTIFNSADNRGWFLGADSDAVTGTLYQTLNGLIPGQTYEVSFYQAAAQQYDLSGATNDHWDVTVGGTIFNGPGATVTGAFTTYHSDTMLLASTGAIGTQTLCDGTILPDYTCNGTSVPDGPWQHQSFTFTTPTTSSGQELLGFLGVGAPIGVPPFVLLSNVSVTAVPEPGNLLALALLGVGLLGVRLVRK